MAKLTKMITDVWPGLKEWPGGIGNPPTTENINDALTLARRNSAVAMALAMYLRENGASDHEAAVAATAATGAKSETHRNKKDVQVDAKVLVESELERRGGHTVVRVALKDKPAKKAPVKKPKKQPETTESAETISE